MNGVIPRALRFVRDLRWKIAAAQLLMIAGSLMGLAMPLILGNIFDAAYPLSYMVGLLLAIGVASEVVNYYKSILAGTISNHVALTVRKSLYCKLQSLPQKFYIDQNTGDLLSTVINDINLFTEALSTGVLYIAEMCLSFIAVVVLMVSIDPVLTLVLAVVLPLMALSSRIVGRPVTQVSKAAQERLAGITDVLNQSISGMEVIKTYTLQGISQGIFQNENEQWYRNVSRLVALKSRNGLFSGLLNIFQIALVVGIGFYRVQLEQLTIGQLTSFILYAQALSSPVRMISRLYVDVKAALAAMRRVFHILDMPEEQEGENLPLTGVKGDIAYENVSFSYGGGRGASKAVLDGIDIRIRAGQSAALIGESGAGKTTLINLLLGFFKPTSGRILLDGEDIARYSLDSLRSHISVVSQNPYIFDLSIRDNIRCGKPDATEEEIVYAAKCANAHEFILQSRNGYDTIAGEKGMRLSGGQRQRIAIARAFLKNAPILLLDEATSALDNFAERAVKEAIERLMQNRTTITVAHRLSTVIHSDVIFYVKDGKVLSRGTHDQLLHSCPEYARLYTTSIGA